MKKMAITRLCFMLLALVGMVSCHETGHDGVKHTNESGYGAEQPEHTGVAEDMEGNTQVKKAGLQQILYGQQPITETARLQEQARAKKAQMAEKTKT